jgi:hypothetical protein
MATMTAIESLTLRWREVRPDTKAPLRISAPTAVICQMIEDFEERGHVPEFDDNVVRFGPDLAVWVDDDLPDNTFLIQTQ